MSDLFRFGIPISLLLLGLVGCGGGDHPPLGGVTGTVTIDGVPLTGVIVAFMPAQGRPATAETDDKGFYRLEYVGGVEGCKVGPATVSFFPPTGGAPSHPIPARYTNSNSTEFKVEIQNGSNKFDFDLKSDTNSSSKGKVPKKAAVPD